ncbi:MAG TPA: DNA polymerase Y family protein, partial [Sphingomicrobium sp.]|nr:DNA polymerase Y family protein [Sphingomicrobium sp.]
AKAGVHVDAASRRAQQFADMDASLRWHDELKSLPVSALRLDPDTVRTLERLGLKTIGALIEIPRLALARRFRGAEDVVDALDRMLGRKPEPLTALAENPPPRTLLKLEEPATHPEAASQALERLIPGLVAELERRHLGARRLVLIGFRVDGSTATASVATAIPSREPKHLRRLLADKAAALDPGFGFDAFALVAEWTEDLGAAQESLVEEPSGERDLARLVDRLTVKLGTRAVRKPHPFESHLPERASGWVSAVSSSLSRSDGEGDHVKHGGGVLAGRQLPLHRLRRSPSPANAGEELKRPHRLLDRPEAIAVIYATPEGAPRRFVWRRAVHDIARVEGPERIAPEWWRERSTARLRDYYRVEDQAGRRYWIFREGVIGDGRGGLPEWYMHGLFG